LIGHQFIFRGPNLVDAVTAGVGWWAVAQWGFGLPTLFALVAAAIVISAAISFVATLSGAIWRTGPE
jgi:hypothetical protein